MPGRCTVFLLLMLAASRAAGGARAGCARRRKQTIFRARARASNGSACAAPPPAQFSTAFGRPGRLKLAFPANPAGAPNTLYLTDYARFQVDRSGLIFTRDGFAYAVFAYRENGKRSAALRVTPAASEKVEIACAGRVSNELPKLRGLLRCDPDNALSLGECR